MYPPVEVVAVLQLALGSSAERMDVEGAVVRAPLEAYVALKGSAWRAFQAARARTVD